jgi:hypothetical protein
MKFDGESLMVLWKLMPDQLFTYPKTPDYVHKKVENIYENDKLMQCTAYEIAFKVDGVWHMHEKPLLQKWNQYAEVQPVEMDFLTN